jgi:hypothetical protein
MKQVLGFGLLVALLTAPALAGGNAGAGGMRATSSISAMPNSMSQPSSPQRTFDPPARQPLPKQGDLKKPATVTASPDRTAVAPNSQTALWNPCAKKLPQFAGFYSFDPTGLNQCPLLNVQGFQPVQTGYFDVLGPNAMSRSFLSTFGPVENYHL